MLQYIYFVKCPNCEDEHFDFFNDAKEFALGCLSKKPIITQIEVDRNDFGECVDSCDLGTVWSWEDLMKDVPTEPELSTFSKFETVDCDDHDAEFKALDNSLDAVPDNFRKPIPADMTVEALVEEMEENEDTVECKWCNELFDKSEVRKEVDLGYLCAQCEAAIKSRGETLTFTEDYDIGKDHIYLEYKNFSKTLGRQTDVDSFDEVTYKSDFTYEVDKDDVALFIAEDCLTEEDVKDLPGGLATLNDFDTEEQYAYFYKHLDKWLAKYEDKVLGHFKDAAMSAFEDDDSYTYNDYEVDQEASRGDDEYHAWRGDQLLYENEEVENSLTTEADSHPCWFGWYSDINNNKKFFYMSKESTSKDPDEASEIMEFSIPVPYTKFVFCGSIGSTQAEKENYQLVEACSSKDTKSFLEELEDNDSYHSHLEMCPECGTKSFDLETGICINCGFN